jgi:hypothetical protein
MRAVNAALSTLRLRSGCGSNRLFLLGEVFFISPKWKGRDYRIIDSRGGQNTPTSKKSTSTPVAKERKEKMRRRNFCKVCGVSLLAIPFLNHDFTVSSNGAIAAGEAVPWIQGSPYLGHSDCRMDFHGLSLPETLEEITHFRTSEPWRRKILFSL